MAKKASPKGKASAKKSTGTKASKRKSPAEACPHKEGVVETGMDGGRWTSTFYEKAGWRWTKA